MLLGYLVNLLHLVLNGSLMAIHLNEEHAANLFRDVQAHDLLDHTQGNRVQDLTL